MGAAWRRRFHFKVPVRNLGIWRDQAVCAALRRTLSFLAEDEFSFEFVQAQKPRALPSYLGFAQDDVQTISPDAIVLFSGGLDSLTGAAEFLLGERGRVVLVSHQSSNMVTSKQNDLVAALRERAPPRSIFHAPVRVDTGSGNAIEFTQRTRSFMFAALALALARMFKRADIRFYENGPVSFNLPVSEHVIGARASRTTHPQFLHRCGELFSLLLSEPIRLHNPYLWLTKSEVLGRLTRNQCTELISRAFSCANVRDATRSGKHCGMCSQCIDRRFGVLAAGLGDHESPEHYQLDLLRGAHEVGLGRTMIECYVLRAHQFATGSKHAFMARYGQVFRALPYLEGSANSNVSKIWDLHQRYGAEVMSVVDAELARNMTVAKVLDVTPNSLLGLVVHPGVQQPAYSDPSEAEPPASERVSAHRRDLRANPILLAIDPKNRKVLFDHGIQTGYGFSVVEKLTEYANEDAQPESSRTERRFIKADKLAEVLGIAEQTLRQHVSRFRRDIAKQFRQHLDRTLLDDDVIENVEWLGYRVNPYVVLVPLQRMSMAAGHVSQVSMQSVTSRPTTP
jgi:7-cyano-7-deazaguanine synthase in queuosine biosynthesis